MIDNIEEFLADVLGTTAGEITEALKDGENYKSQAEIAAYVKEQFDGRIYKAKTDSRKEGHGRGLKESLTAKEKELKAKLGVEGTTIEEIVDAAIEAAKKHSALNPDDVKNSEVYINETKRLKQLLADKEKEISEKENTFTKKETRRLIEEEGVKLLDKMKFVLPEDAEMREEYLQILFDKLEDENTKIQKSDGKKLVVLDANGRPKENEQGTKELTFEDWLGSKAKRFFKQAVADNRQSPANKNLDDKSKTTGDLPEIKSTEDYYKALNSEKDTTKLKAIKAHYDKLVEDGAIKN